MSENNQNLNRPRPEKTAKGEGIGPLEEGMKIDGLQQVIEMLKYADPAFRESLLKRLQARDPKLAQNLRKIMR